MRLRSVLLTLAIPAFTGTLAAQRPDSLSEEVRRYVAVDTGVVA